MYARITDIVRGFVKYADKYLYASMNDLQEIAARAFLSRALAKRDTLEKAIASNPLLQTFSVLSEDGTVEIDEWAELLKNEIAKKGKMTVTVPMFGRFTFYPDDIDRFKECITDGKT